MTNCFVPGCKSNSKSSRKKGEKTSFFSPPRNEAKFEKWKRMIPRKDRPLRRCDRVCHLHFIPEHIQHDYVHIIKGETVRIPRSKPCLAEDAYPCIFPGLPKYLTKIPKKRKPPANRSIPAERITKKQPERTKSSVDKTHCPKSDSDVYCGLNLDDLPVVVNDSPTFSFANIINNIDKICLPSPQWGTHVYEDKNSVIFSHVTFMNDNFAIDKMIFLNESMMPKFSNNVSVVTTDFTSTIRSIHSLETVIMSVENRRVCRGIVSAPVTEGWKQVTIKKMHDKCKIFISDQLSGDLCTNCKNEMQRLTRIHQTVAKRKDLRDGAKLRLQQENRRLHKQVLRLTKKFVGKQGINAENEAVDDSYAIEIRIENDLPTA
uniref:THAP-type domain-containing protein n=1 Tax=Strigamia maritima TaxID=126957 RepID=T1JLP4_STRMM